MANENIPQNNPLEQQNLPPTITTPAMSVNPAMAMPQPEEEEVPEYSESDFIIPVKLTPAIELECKKIFKEEMARILAERQEMYQGKGFEDQVQDNQDLYDGIIEPPQMSWQSANYHIWLSTMMVDIGYTTAVEHTLSANPVVLMEPKEEMGTKDIEDNLSTRENRFDYKLRKELQIEKLLSPTYREAFIQGTSFVKVPIVNRIEYLNYKKTYRTNDEEIAAYNNGNITGGIKEFTTDFPDYNDMSKKAGKQFMELMLKKEVTANKQEKRQIYYDCKPYRIDIRKLWLRPKIEDLMRHRFIGEEIDFTWADIASRAINGHYLKNQVEILKGKLGTDYYKKDLTVFECRIFADLEGNGKMMRYMMTMEKTNEIILRLVYYPNQDEKMGVIMDIKPFRIMPKDDSVYGYGLCERMKDPNKMMDNSWNILFNGYTLAQNPLIDTDDPDLDFTAQDYAPLSVIRHQKGTTVRPFELTPQKMQTAVMTRLSEQFAEYATRISSLQTGRESPSDPKAPMRKTAMLLDRSDRGLKYYYKELLKCFCDLAETIEKMEIKFCPDYFNWINKGNKINMDKDIFYKNVRYTTAETDLDKQANLQLLVGFVQFLVAYYPDKMKDPQIRYEVMKAFMESTGGIVERLKDKINMSPKEEIEKQFKGKLKDIIRKILGEPTNQKVPPLPMGEQGQESPAQMPPQEQPPMAMGGQ